MPTEPMKQAGADVLAPSLPLLTSGQLKEIAEAMWLAMQALNPGISGGHGEDG